MKATLKHHPDDSEGAVHRYFKGQRTSGKRKQQEQTQGWHALGAVESMA